MGEETCFICCCGISALDFAPQMPTVTCQGCWPSLSLDKLQVELQSCWEGGGVRGTCEVREGCEVRGREGV